MKPHQVSERLAQLSLEQPECRIYRVYEHLRSINGKAYDPEVIAIGPYHHGNKNLEMLEEHKLIYLHSLLNTKKETFDKFYSAIEPLEQTARKCYAEDINLNPAEFIVMLVLDGCFIIQLVRKYLRIDAIAENDPVFQMDWICLSLMRDLTLFENQIPFFILLKLFELIYETSSENDLMHLLLMFFHHVYPGKGCENHKYRRPDEIKHLLDLVHGNWVPSSYFLDIDEDTYSNEYRFIDCAKELKEANVQFAKADGENSSLFDVRFQNGTLTLAPLDIRGETESFFRNMIAYEQYSDFSQPSFVTGYAKVLDCLIDTSKDVEILSAAKIIHNCMGNDEVVADMFNKLTDGVIFPEDSTYIEIFHRVNTHCDQPTNRYWAALRHNYLNGPWATLSIFVGFIILLLTIVQAVCSLVQVLKS